MNCSEYVDLDFEHMAEDPYPTFKDLRQSKPVCYVPAMNAWMVTGHREAEIVLQNGALFGPDLPDQNMLTTVGANLLHQDGDLHRTRRMIAAQTFKPATIQNHWAPILTSRAHALLDGFIDKGEAELIESYIGEATGDMMCKVMGCEGVSAQTMLRWSQDLIDGFTEACEKPETMARSLKTSSEIDAVVQEMSIEKRERPDQSVISFLVNAPDPIPLAEIAADLKMMIAGGVNEPRDGIATAVVGLAENPDQFEAARADPSTIDAVFEEAVRWVAPIGLTGRHARQDQPLGNVTIPAGALVLVALGSVNRDETVYEAPDVFDFRRGQKTHFAFGSGAHRCLGAALARVFGARILLPALLSRISRLELAGPPRFSGFGFRGPLSVPARWQRA